MHVRSDPGSTPFDPVDSLTEALVDANDQLLVLYELASLTTHSLDEHDSVSEILGRAGKLLGSDALTFTVDGMVVQGAPETGDASRLRAEQHAAEVHVENQGLTAQLVATRAGRSFGTADHKLLTAVANMALGAVQTSRHHQETLAGAVAMRDHDTASALAQLALPAWRPSLDGVEVFARSDPARAAGGDLFTFAVIDDVLHFVVGDVSGKGLPAAMMMTTVLSASTAAFPSAGADGPGEVLRTIDRWVHDYLAEASIFVTLMAGSYDPNGRRLHVASAGHGPILFVEAGEVRSIDPAMPPIGVLPLADFEPGGDAVLEPSPGSLLAVCSDGFTEQQNDAGDMWGDSRLHEALRCSELAVDQLGAELFDTVEKFAGSAEQTDDRTLLLLGITDS